MIDTFGRSGSDLFWCSRIPYSQEHWVCLVATGRGREARLDGRRYHTASAATNSIEL